MKWIRAFGLLLGCLLLAFNCLATNYDWTGAVSSDWSNRNNWRISTGVPAVPPTNADNVYIGNSSTNVTGSGANAGQTATSFISNPTINSGYTANCAALFLGTVKSVTLTVTGVLNVVGDLTQLHSSAGGNISNTLTGTGTLGCNNLLVGDTTSPPLPNAGLGLYSMTYTTQLTTTLSNINIAAQLKLNTTSSTANLFIIFPFTAYNLCNPVFNLNGGSVSVGTSIFTSNSSYVNSSATLQNTAKVLVNSSVANTNLYLGGATPIVLDANGAGSVDFYTSGTYTSTVIYNYSGAATQTVYGNTQTRLDVSPSVYQNVQFANPGQKAIQSGTMTVAGNWTSAGGKIDAVTNDPIVTFQGTAQTLTDNGSDGSNGVTFKRVNFIGGGTKLLSSGNFNIASTGVLTVSGSSTLNANGNLTLFSTATSSAGVAGLTTGNSITGNVNVQRYLLGGNTKSGTVYTARGYRLLSSPVNINNTGFFSFSYIGNTALTGGPGSGFTVTINNPTIYLYREDVVPSVTTFNSGKHKGLTSINADNTVNVSGTAGPVQVPVGNGYIFYFVGNISNPSTKATGNPTTGPENTIITATGTLNQSDIVTKLWYTAAGATVAPINTKLSYNSALGTSAGYNMVGNPYAATLNLATVITDNPTINSTIYTLDNVNPGQEYIAYNSGGSSSPKASQYIASGQGFIVQAKAANATLTFHETQKAINNQPPTLLMGLPINENAITGFYLKMEKDSLINDYCGVYFGSNSSAKFDSEDAKDLDGASPQVYLSSYSEDGIRTAINHLPDYRPGIKNKLYVNASADGLYQLKIEGIRNIDPLYDVWLKDKMIKDSLNISRYGVYNFRITRSDTASFGGNRFEIIVRPKPQPEYSLISFSAKKIVSGIEIKWETANEGNFTGFEVEKMLPGTPAQYTTIYSEQSSTKKNYSYVDADPAKGANTYRLKQNNLVNKNIVSDPKTVIIQDDAGTGVAISVYPNPAAEMINVSLPLMAASVPSLAKIYSYNGTLVMQKNIQGNSWTQNVTQLMPGTYLIELSKPNGELIGRSKFIKK